MSLKHSVPSFEGAGKQKLVYTYLYLFILVYICLYLLILSETYNSLHFMVPLRYQYYEILKCLI